MKESFGILVTKLIWKAENESVILGKLLDEGSFKRDEKHINIDDTINIDFIREYKELHEVKKSKAIEEAGVWRQILFVLFETTGCNRIKGTD